MTSRICLILLTFYFLLQPNSSSASDFEQAAEAYRKSNYALALPAFTRLAEQGDARAQTVLALMHKYGEGTPESPQKAFEWYQRAAELNYPPAQFNLGSMYQEGLGIEKNPGLAIEWYTRAASGGFERANEKLEELNSAAVPSKVIVDQDIPWPETWNFRLPNSHRQVLQEEASSPLLTEPSPSSNSYRVQLGAMGTLQAAENLWDQLVLLSPALFVEQTKFIESSRGGPNPIYRLQAGPFPGLSAANDFCLRIRQQSIRTGCLPLLSTHD